MRFVPVAFVPCWVLVAVPFVLSAACARGEPPTPPGSPSVAPPEWPVPSASLVERAPAAPPAAATNIPSAPASAPSAPAAAAEAPRPTAESPSPEPAQESEQTHELPDASGAAFEARVSALWNAVVGDDAKQGQSFFFPLAAYRQVKDVADPEADWKHRLVAAYARDIHALHLRLADSSTDATLSGLKIPTGRARWVEPGEEWNKLGYYRVYGSKLHYEVNGVDHSFDVRSLISWRGQWYVVHLSSIAGSKHVHDADASRPHP